MDQLGSSGASRVSRSSWVPGADAGPASGSPARRVIVGVSGTLGNLAAVHAAAAEARRTHAQFVPVLAWAPVGGEVAYARAPCSPLLHIWQADASRRLRTALLDAFGGLPPGVVTAPILVRGAPGSSLVRIADRADDLLVVGTGRRGHLLRPWRGSVARYCERRAGCAVLRVPAPDLIELLRRPVPAPTAWA
jgi:nucleotide-binding universal stress UspA family protein